MPSLLSTFTVIDLHTCVRIIVLLTVDEDEFKDLCIDERRRIVHEQIESHKVELLEIKEKDPEYYQFLLENDNAILEFAGKELTSEDKDIPSSTPPSASNVSITLPPFLY